MKYILIKTFWFFIVPLQKLYYFIFRPKTRGVKCLVENNGKFLMVKLNYANCKWVIPGGGVKKNESSLEAAIREVKEEAGVEVSNVKYVGFYKTNGEYKEDTVEIYYGNSSIIQTSVDPIEVEKADWFERAKLPEDRSSSSDKIFEIYDEFRFK